MQATIEEREEWEALVDADTLHLLPTEALIASIKSLAERLLAMTAPPMCRWCGKPIEIQDSGDWGHVTLAGKYTMRFWCGPANNRVEPC